MSEISRLSKQITYTPLWRLKLSDWYRTGGADLVSGQCTFVYSLTYNQNLHIRCWIVQAAVYAHGRHSMSNIDIHCASMCKGSTSVLVLGVSHMMLSLALDDKAMQLLMYLFQVSDDLPKPRGHRYTCMDFGLCLMVKVVRYYQLDYNNI